MLSILAKRVGILLKHQLLERFILRNEIVRVGGEEKRPQLINDLVSSGLILSDLRIQANQRVADHGLHHDIALVTVQFIRWNILPTVFLERRNNHPLSSVVFVKNRHCQSSPMSFIAPYSQHRNAKRYSCLQVKFQPFLRGKFRFVALTVKPLIFILALNRRYRN